MPTYRITGKFDYQAWPEMTHSARMLRSMARDTAQGHTHLVAAAVVMTAFSVEAFALTLGPRVYGQAWTSGDPPAERFKLRTKIKEIAKKFGISVDYGCKPWKDIADLIRARDLMAHPAPRARPINEVVEAADEHLARMMVSEVVDKVHHPMHDIDVLDEAADRVERALVEIWVASGESRHVLGSWPYGTWQVALEP